MISDGTGKTAGFHLSSLYRPVGWRDIAAAWESPVNKESGSAAAIKTFKKTLFSTWVAYSLHYDGLPNQLGVSTNIGTAFGVNCPLERSV
jgi:hypothetical protein